MPEVASLSGATITLSVTYMSACESNTKLVPSKALLFAVSVLFEINTVVPSFAIIGRYAVKEELFTYTFALPLTARILVRMFFVLISVNSQPSIVSVFPPKLMNGVDISLI